MLKPFLVLILGFQAWASPLVVQMGTGGRLPYDPANHGVVLISFYNAVLGQLIDFSEDQKIAPSLLERFFWDYKNKEYKLVLKKGLKFHHGRPVTIEDLEFSLVRFFYTTQRADQRAALKNILGVDKIQKGSTYKPWATEGIRKIDASSIAIRLKNPDYTFPYCFRDGWISIVPKEELSEDYVSWKKFPIGAGPYKVVSTELNSVSLELVETQKNFNQVKQLKFTTSPNPDVDLLLFSDSNTHARLTKKVGYKPAAYAGIFFNSKNTHAQNPQFRARIEQALNEKSNYMQTEWTVLHEPLTSNFGIKASVQKKRFGKQQQPVEVEASWFTGENLHKEGPKAELLTRLTAQLQSAGIKVKWQESRHPTFTPEDSKTAFKVDFRGTLVADPLILFRAYEPGGLLAPFFVGNLNSYQKLLRGAEAQNESAKKQAYLNKLVSFFLENKIVIPLFEQKPIYFVNTKRIAEISPQNGVGFDIRSIVLKEETTL